MKCIVDKCENQEWQGRFHGNLCMPCYEFLAKELERKKQFSQAYRNHINKCVDYLRQNEFYLVSEKYDKMEEK